MAAPSKNFTVIADSAIDADSPITADLMEDLRDNDIHLEEWLGKNYTAAVDHDHDGTNSALINLASTLSVYEEHKTFDPTGASWIVSTGSIGFTPALLHIRWGYSPTGTTTDPAYHGWGWAWGANSADQCGVSMLAHYDSTPNGWITSGFAYDTGNIMGFHSGAGYTSFYNWLTSFATEYAQVTAFVSAGITITTGSGSWGSNASNSIFFLVWGN